MDGVIGLTPLELGFMPKTERFVRDVGGVAVVLDRRTASRMRLEAWSFVAACWGGYELE